MDSKLVLSMDSAVISSIQGYASKNNASISRLVEDFFKNLLASEGKEKAISPLVQELSGIIPADFSRDDDYIHYLEAKHE